MLHFMEYLGVFLTQECIGCLQTKEHSNTQMSLQNLSAILGS